MVPQVRKRLWFCALMASVVLAGRVAASELRIAVAARPSGFANPYASLITDGLHPYEAMFDALTRIGADGNALPALAAQWTAETPTRWVFALKPGMRFSNGEPIDPTAVIATFRYLQSEEAQKYFIAGEIRNVSLVEARNDHTVVIETRTPDAILPKRLSLAYIVPPRAWAQTGAGAFARAPVGSGPYALDPSSTESRLVLVRNPTSWRAASLDRIELEVVPDQTARAQALMSGKVDLAFLIGMEDMASLREQNFAVLARPVSVIGALAFNVEGSTGPLSKLAVRRALNLAIDRQAMSDVLYHGLITPASQGAIPGVTGFNPTLPPLRYDPAEARRLLAEAGYPNGMDLTLKALIAGIPEAATLYEAIAAYLAAVGVHLHIVGLTGPEWFHLWYGGHWDADLLSFGMNSALFADAIRTADTFSCRKPGAFFCDPALDAAIAGTNAVFDLDERSRALQAVMAQIDQLAPALILFPTVVTFGYGRRIGGIAFERGMLQLERLTVSP